MAKSTKRTTRAFLSVPVGPEERARTRRLIASFARGAKVRTVDVMRAALRRGLAALEKDPKLTVEDVAVGA